ncbi:hypothetical protein DAI22_06g283306 [Oryza sativa Japonica Group]|nr:hypothetical protein DAI22_06g283306 [Oryza sativa Japonica Group]
MAGPAAAFRRRPRRRSGGGRGRRTSAGRAEAQLRCSLPYCAALSAAGAPSGTAIEPKREAQCGCFPMGPSSIRYYQAYPHPAAGGGGGGAKCCRAGEYCGDRRRFVGITPLMHGSSPAILCICCNTKRGNFRELFCVLISLFI